jgi:hypothetical protein
VSSRETLALEKEGTTPPTSALRTPRLAAKAKVGKRHSQPGRFHGEVGLDGNATGTSFADAGLQKPSCDVPSAERVEDGEQDTIRITQLAFVAEGSRRWMLLGKKVT